MDNKEKKQLSESDICDLFITSALKSAGWEGMKTRLKQSLLEACNLHTIVRLPNGVFNHYTGIKTNLLFFTKGRPTEHVWFYEHPYPEGVKSYNKTKPMRFEEFETEIKWWGSEADGFKKRKQTEQAWKVPVADIVARNYRFAGNREWKCMAPSGWLNICSALG